MLIDAATLLNNGELMSSGGGLLINGKLMSNSCDQQQWSLLVDVVKLMSKRSAVS